MAKGKKTGGRVKGSSNIMTKDLKEAILEAAEAAGGGSLGNYLAIQAENQPSAFLSLLGKVLPLTISGDNKNPLKMTLEWLKPSE